MAHRRLHTAYDVSTNRWLLARYAYVEERLFTTLAGWIWSTARLEEKVELGRISYEDAQHTDALRRRVEELYPPVEQAPQPPAVATLEHFCNEVANAEDPVERLVGVFRVAKPGLLAAYRQHLADTDDLTDAPTALTLRRLIAEEEEHIHWGETLLRGLLAQPERAERAAAWKRHLEAAWEAIGGVRAALVATPPYRNPAPPPRGLTSFPARDGRFRLVTAEEYHVTSMGDTPDEIIRHLLYVNAYGEVEAEDVLGRVLADLPEMPWGMRLDLARQMWDEARHAELSWRRLEELGGPPQPTPPVPPTVLYPMQGLADPLERLLVLQRVVEGRATERHRHRVRYLAQELGDPQTARLFEYIVADERAHIGYSNWIPRVIGDDPERLARLERVQAEAEQVFERFLTRRRDTTAGMAVAGESR